jgi:hypothetical protein
MASHVTSMGNKRNACRILGGNLKEGDHLGELGVEEQIVKNEYANM